MFNLGWLEVGLILLVVVIIFGPSKIPQLGSTLGKTLRGFKEEMEGEPEMENESDEDYS